MGLGVPPCYLSAKFMQFQQHLMYFLSMSNIDFMGKVHQSRRHTSVLIGLLEYKIIPVEFKSNL